MLPPAPPDLTIVETQDGETRYAPTSVTFEDEPDATSPGPGIIPRPSPTPVTPAPATGPIRSVSDLEDQRDAIWQRMKARGTTPALQAQYIQVNEAIYQANAKGLAEVALPTAPTLDERDMVGKTIHDLEVAPPVALPMEDPEFPHGQRLDPALTGPVETNLSPYALADAWPGFKRAVAQDYVQTAKTWTGRELHDAKTKELGSEAKADAYCARLEQVLAVALKGLSDEAQKKAKRDMRVYNPNPSKFIVDSANV